MRMTRKDVRKHMRARGLDPAMLDKARAVKHTLQKSVNDLGPDLGGGSAVDLVLDNHLDVRDSEEARTLLLIAEVYID